MNLILRQFKSPAGGLDFPKLFDIPRTERITALAERDFSQINMVIIASLTLAFENLNLKRGLNEIQILNLSEAIIDSAMEDNLALEDLLLFLQAFVRGKYPMSYESLDIPKFMKALDIYREERWQSGISIRDERIAQWQGLGPSTRTIEKDELSEHLSNITGRMSEMKKALSESKHENNILKQSEKFYGK
jgi:hypothetical protein